MPGSEPPGRSTGRREDVLDWMEANVEGDAGFDRDGWARRLAGPPIDAPRRSIEPVDGNHLRFETVLLSHCELGDSHDAATPSRRFRHP